MGAAMCGPINQIGYVVQDLQAGIQWWVKTLGVGPWTVFRNVTLDGEYRAAPTTVKIDVALSYQGDVQVELIEVLTDTPSPYRDENGLKLGIHHLAWVVEDCAASVAAATARGLTVAFSCYGPTANVVYLESVDQPGVLIEYIENPGMAELMRSGVEATRAWDGGRPILLEINNAAAV